jgi:nitrogen regulatory protein P-II 1
MKIIIAVIKPDRLEAVKQELYKVEVNLITVSEVLGHGRQMGVTEVYRGVKEMGNLLRKIQLFIAVNDTFVEPTIKAIIKGGKTGEIGDGKIFVLPLEECVRIRAGQPSVNAAARPSAPFAGCGYQWMRFLTCMRRKVYDARGFISLSLRMPGVPGL